MSWVRGIGKHGFSGVGVWWGAAGWRAARSVWRHLTLTFWICKMAASGKIKTNSKYLKFSLFLRQQDKIQVPKLYEMFHGVRLMSTLYIRTLAVVLSPVILINVTVLFPFFKRPGHLWKYLQLRTLLDLYTFSAVFRGFCETKHSLNLD